MGCCMCDLLPCFFDSPSCGDSCYNPGPNLNELHAKKISNELAEMKETMNIASIDSEKKILDYMDESMNKLIFELEKVNSQDFGGVRLNINISGIRERQDILRDKVVGLVGRRIDDRLQLKDADLSVILEERDDAKREKNFKQFCKKVRKDALLELKKQLVATMEQQDNMIRREIILRIQELESNLRNKQENLEKIKNNKGQQSDKLNKLLLEQMYKYEVCDIILTELNE